MLASVEGWRRAGVTNEKPTFVVVVMITFAIFFSTADKSIPYHIDPFTNAISAASIGRTGSPILGEYAELAIPERLAVFGWIVPSPRGPVSQYPPGTALLAAPVYALVSDDGFTIDTYAYNNPSAEPIELRIPPLWPAALVASFTSSLAVGFTVLTVRRAAESMLWAIGAGIVLATGTGLWLNGGYQLWQHGPASMWVAASLWAASRSKWWASGLLAGLAVLTRPPMAIISAGIGVVSSLRERSWRPALRHGAGALVGTAALLAYNFWLFDTLTVSGGYGSGLTENLVGSDLGWYLENLLGGFFSIDRGLFVWTPIIAIAAAGVPLVWKSTPAWAVGGFVGAIALLLVQFRLNRYSGGDGFYSYRYPLEAVVASTPILAMAAKQLWEKTSALRLALFGTAAASIVFHLIALVREVTS